MAKTCERCQDKIVEETLIATNDGKYYCQGCYKQNWTKNNCDHFLHDDVILNIKENQIIHEVFLCILRFFYISTLLGSLRWN